MFYDIVNKALQFLVPAEYVYYSPSTDELVVLDFYVDTEGHPSIVKVSGNPSVEAVKWVYFNLNYIGEL